jgi:hypothetical protein
MGGMVLNNRMAATFPSTFVNVAAMKNQIADAIDVKIQMNPPKTNQPE